MKPQFSPVLWYDGLYDFFKWIKDTPDIHIIHILRDNSMDWLKSLYLSKKTKLYSKQPYPENTKIKIPEWGAINRVISKNWIDNRLFLLSETNPYIQIKYENFLRIQITKLILFGCS